MLVFAIGGGIAGLAGCLFTNWGGFISPTVFGLSQSAQIIIFVLVGGLGTLVGPILGAVAIEYLITLIGSQQTLNADLMLGVVLVAFVLLVPQGVVPVVRGVTQRLFQHRRGTALGEPEGRTAVTVPLLRSPTGLTMRFDGVTAVEAVDFALGEMELRCLIGPNGAGKSTFFKMLTGQLAPSAGTVVIPRPGHHRCEDPRDCPSRRRHQDAGAECVQRAVGA